MTVVRPSKQALESTATAGADLCAGAGRNGRDAQSGAGLGHAGFHCAAPRRPKGRRATLAERRSLLAVSYRFEADPVVNCKLIFTSSPGGYLLCSLAFPGTVGDPLRCAVAERTTLPGEP